MDHPSFLPSWNRPIRIPPHLALLHADPPFAFAGQTGSWVLPFELTRDVPAGGSLKLHLFGGRNDRGEFLDPQTDRPGETGSLRARNSAGERLPMRPGERTGIFDMRSSKGLRTGERIEVLLGESRGITPSKVRILDKFFLLYCPPGPNAPRPTAIGGQDQIVAACTMHVLGGSVHQLRAYAPSQAVAHETFTVLVRPEDQYGNLSSEFLQDVELFVDTRELPARIDPVPDSTCVQVRLQLPAEGVYRLKVRDRRGGLETVANPIISRKVHMGPKLYWGMIHGHTEMSDGMGTIDYYFRQMRDEAALDFAASGDHDHVNETSEAMWERTSEAVARWNQPGRFVTFLGYEWAKWRRNGDGDRNVYYLHDQRPMYRSDEGHYPTPADLFAAVEDEQAIVIPHHTAHAGNFCDFKDHDPVHERLIEIFQVRGSYECAAEEGNPVPERGPEPTIALGYVSRALAMGWRVGFTAGGDDHSGHAGTDFQVPIPGEQVDYKAGLTGVLAEHRTRDAIWKALWSRRVFATTGPRMLLSFTLSGNAMGSELSLRRMPELAHWRVVNVEFHGTAPIKRIDVIRNNNIVHSATADGPDAKLHWEDYTDLEQTWFPPAEFCDHCFCFYYPRVTQIDGEVAWASPVWIDP